MKSEIREETEILLNNIKCAISKPFIKVFSYIKAFIKEYSAIFIISLLFAVLSIYTLAPVSDKIDNGNIIKALIKDNYGFFMASILFIFVMVLSGIIYLITLMMKGKENEKVSERTGSN